MKAQATSDLRGVLAGMLVLLLALAGAGRGMAAGASPTDPRPSIAGVAVPLCHTGSAAPDPAAPGRPADPDCCGACALLAAAVLPVAPELYRPGSVRASASRIATPGASPDGLRIRSPRQARAPPVGSADLAG